MEKKSSSNFAFLLNDFSVFAAHKNIPQKYVEIFREFTNNYQKVLLQYKKDPNHYIDFFFTFVALIKEQFQHPYQFQPYHQKIRAPFDYYKFSLDFIRPLIDFAHSTVKGVEYLNKIERLLKQGNNVIIFANHQTELDPQAMILLLEHSHPTFSERLIFVAGTRVTTDPIAIPFSMGCNLLCIYSKKYMHNTPEEKHKKQMHNKRTMTHMVTLLSQGGHAIYVAPSGGRDRANTEGTVEIAPFDSHNLEMFYLMAQKAQSSTYFVPLALSTYHLLPPPLSTDTEIGERRTTRGGTIHLSFGDFIDMANFPGKERAIDKKEERQIRSEYIWNLIKTRYLEFPKEATTL